MTERLPERWHHQTAAFDFAIERFLRKLYGVMLAMVMGAGKTRVACELALAQDARQMLIVCPLRVVDVWMAQLARFAPAYRPVPLGDGVDGGARKLTEARRWLAWSDERPLARPLALIINYDSARIQPFAGWSAARPWDMVIADECHRIKEPRGRTSLYMARLGQVARRRLGLTGTPMPHEPTDIWGQFRFLDHTHLDPTFAQFKMRYAVMGGYFDKQVKSWKDLDDLERRFRELAYRVDESVLDLPPEMDEVRWASLSPDGQRIYAAMERDMIAWISESAFVTAANAMVKLTRLQQITSGWAPDESRTLKPVDRAKEDLLEELLEDLREPVVVFCRFKSDLEAVHRVAAKLGLGSLELSGDKDELTGWQKQPGWPYVLAAQIDSGSEGVDMTRARVAIYYSIGFRLDKYLQSRARIRRPPQQRPCLFLHLQARGTVDEYVLHAVEARRDLVDSVLQELKTKGAVHALA